MRRPASFEDPGDRFASISQEAWLEKATSEEAVVYIARAMCSLLSDEATAKIIDPVRALITEKLTPEEISFAAVCCEYIGAFED